MGEARPAVVTIIDEHVSLAEGVTFISGTRVLPVLIILPLLVTIEWPWGRE